MLEDSQVEEESAQRRSKVEMACDILLTMSKGTVKPTKIMQRANLTWTTLLMYLNALVKAGFVKREMRGKARAYFLTSRGVEVLQSYVALRRGLELIDFDSLNKKSFAETLRAAVAKPERAPAAELADRLEEMGWTQSEPKLKGKSGVTHQFGIVAEDNKGNMRGFVITEDVDENTILGLFVAHMDTDMDVEVVYSGAASPSAVQRAKEYGIRLTKWEEIAKGRTG